MELFVERKNGVIYKVGKYRKRYGILIGAILTTIFIFVISNTVMTVEIKGNTNVSAERILTVANNIGIKKGSSIQGIEYSYSERAIMLEIPELSWVSVHNRGNRIIISVAEETPTPEVVGTRPCNVISTKDALITNVKVFDGQLNYIIGDAVKKGDVLIKGIYPLIETHNRVVHASGEITGIYTEVITLTQNFTEEEVVYETPKIRTKFDFFGFKIPLYFKNPDLEKVNITKEDTPFNIFGKDIPIGLEKTSYEPYKIEKITYTPEEARQMLENKVITYEHNFYGDCEILERKEKRTETAEGLKIEITYKIEGEIGIESELFLK
jgi:similar to stage IV sporulation protein